ncbi:MAG: hypothetical protein KDC54_05965 [Lewinella sp.]|nr:hypothetical protein [Lewinella sp.]
MRILLIGLPLMPLLLAAQPAFIDLQPNATVTAQGELADGRPMPDLSWAWNSSNACFVSTQAGKFTGHHVLYQVTLPRRAVLTITVEPDDPEADFSLYAYSVGLESDKIVPDLPGCVSCEADYRWDYPRVGQTQDHTRSVELRAVNNPYTVFIGVVGAAGRTSGGFQLHLALEGGETPSAEAAVTPPTFRAPAEKGTTLAYRGDLADGAVLTDLSWAWDSQNACFVATQQRKFTGHQLLYVTDLPANSELTITLTPDDPSHNMSLYAYSVGTLRLVPDLPGCVSCEADFQSDYGEDGPIREVSLRAGRNPYSVVIGVVGAEGLREGGFLFKLSVE